MKQLLMMLLAISLFAACKNDTKQKDKSSNRPEKDDYRSGEKETEKETDNTNKTDYSSNSSDWSAADVSKFNNQCLTEIAKNNQEFADKFCPCFLDKMQLKFTSMADMELKSTELQGKEAAEDCIETLGLAKKEKSINTLNSGSGWPQAERNTFISSCEREAKAKGTDKFTAKDYCACMLDKMEALYPDVNEMANLTSNELNKIVNKYRNGCLEEH